MTLASALGRLARLFYRRIEVAGAEHVPAAGPVLFVANHANGLVDPMVVMAVVERPITFVAKSTLWKIPGIRQALVALEAVPVVRRVDAKEDGDGRDRNTESLARLAAALDAGRAVLIFPEGRSHSDPALSPIRTGAARVALMAKTEVPIVPIGLWFARKEEFRSDVLVRFGAPLAPAERTVAAVTHAIEEGLRDATLNAERWAEHDAAGVVEAIYGPRLAVDGGEAGTLEKSFRTRRLLLDARSVLARTEPGAVERLERRARAYRRLRDRAGLAGSDEARRAHGAALGETLLGVARLPLALLGAVAFWIPYRLVGIVANALVGNLRDQIALYKLLSGMVLHVLFYAAEVALAGVLLGARGAVAAALLLPIAGLAALSLVDESARDSARLRRALLSAGGARVLDVLARERAALAAECDRLAEVYRGASAAAPDELDR